MRKVPCKCLARVIFWPAGKTKSHSNAEVRVNTRQTDCQHSGLITVSVSPVSLTIPWRSSLAFLQEILFHTRAFLTFMYSVISVINYVYVVIHAEMQLNSVIFRCWRLKMTWYYSLRVLIQYKVLYSCTTLPLFSLWMLRYICFHFSEHSWKVDSIWIKANSFKTKHWNKAHKPIVNDSKQPRETRWTHFLEISRSQGQRVAQ